MSAGFGRIQPAVHGFIISLAIVFGGSASYAEGLVGLGGRSDVGLFGQFSAEEMHQLEHASTVGAVSARLATMGVDQSFSKVLARPASAGDVAPKTEAEVFQRTGRVLPLLVTRPDTTATVAQSQVKLRPGLVAPVGVSRGTFRSPTLSERSAR